MYAKHSFACVSDVKWNSACLYRKPTSSWLFTVNYASLVATNAVRYRLAAGFDKTLLEFGLRRAQGPNGGLTASKYCYVGGFDGTSNVLAGKEFRIPVRGTQAHSFVNSFNSLDELSDESLCTLKSDDGSQQINVLQTAQSFLAELLPLFTVSTTHEGELASFVSYACSFPSRFTVLIDTYDSLSSGLTNFLAVALAINKLGYKAVGVRLDSGDLAYQSLVVLKRFRQTGEKYGLDWFKDMSIVASNDIDEETLYSLKDQKNAITSFGIGTNLVTCSSQPALGCVYKIVEIDNKPCMKLAQELVKMTFPGKKKVFRLYGKDGTAILDLIMHVNEKSPDTTASVLCRDPFLPTKRAHCHPSRVEEILVPVWGAKTEASRYNFDLEEVRNFVQESLNTLRSDVKRKLNPTPYKVSLSDNLYESMHKQWLDNAPIGTLN